MKKPILIALLIVWGITVHAQIRYSGKIEIGYLKFQYTMIDVSPGPGWKGYNLDNDQNGIDINLINGVSFKNKIFTGLGIGYVNFEGINGVSVFVDFEYIPLKTKLSPLINIKIGNNHIWNQYEKGSEAPLIELGGGITYKLNESLNLYARSGIFIAQDALLIPIRIGLKLNRIK